jgi:hypothetical protein
MSATNRRDFERVCISAYASVRPSKPCHKFKQLFMKLDAATNLNDEVAGNPPGDWKELLIISLSLVCISTKRGDGCHPPSKLCQLNTCIRHVPDQP